ncbi:hypothetical protein EJ997_07885 [Flaviflexus ciconiae]|uniref:Lipoprotein n=1 Tax=Flaviflexus ciconiae TaxID=2496867 RepID=A0A3S9PXZ3_9ACTO|nr:hypothetical protein [Flaviflexus ciconiae]AZQ77263.1 hypothetical protein EJ997_07885 [Flaviflexus ciconiae]
MGLRRVTALVVAGLLMVACSDGEAETNSKEPTDTPTAEATTEAPEPTPTPDYPYDMTDGVPRELAEYMYDACAAEYAADLADQGVISDPSKRVDNDGKYSEYGEVVRFDGSFRADRTDHEWHCRILYDDETGETIDLVVEELNKEIRERPSESVLETCHTGVADKLVSPASAEFSSPVYNENDDGTWTISGYVDSMNRLGVPLRSQWQCRVEFSGFLQDWYSTGVTVTER